MKRDLYAGVAALARAIVSEHKRDPVHAEAKLLVRREPVDVQYRPDSAQECWINGVGVWRQVIGTQRRASEVALNGDAVSVLKPNVNGVPIRLSDLAAYSNPPQSIALPVGPVLTPNKQTHHCP